MAKEIGRHPTTAPKSGVSKFAIPASLSQVKLTQPTHQEESARQTKDEYQIDSGVNIDPEKFRHELARIRDRLEADNKMTLATTLNPDHAELTHNRWVHKVKNEIQQKMLGNEKQIVSELREKLKVGNLFLEIEVVEPQKLQSDDAPYTMQEKLEKMKEKNPDLESFLRRFNANIQYD